MLDVLFHIVFAIFVFSGVVLFPAFAWLKKHDADDTADCQHSMINSHSM